MLETADSSHKVLIETGAVKVMINILSLKYIILGRQYINSKIILIYYIKHFF